jgi:hypothetical protein
VAIAKGCWPAIDDIQLVGSNSKWRGLSRRRRDRCLRPIASAGSVQRRGARLPPSRGSGSSIAAVSATAGTGQRLCCAFSMRELYERLDGRLNGV